MKKLAVIIPWDSPFMYTAAGFNMMNWERPIGYEVRFIQGAGWCPANKHNDGLRQALAWEADYVMFNGGDHLCPKDILIRMLRRIVDQGWDMVHATPPSRGIPPNFTVPFIPLSFKVVGPLPKDYISNCPKSSIKILTYEDEPQQSHIAGTGNVMMKMDIIKKLEPPFFEEVIKEDGMYGRYPIQDSKFIARCTIDHGAKMFFDSTIKLIHLDVFGIDETYSERFKDKNKVKWTPSRELREYE